MGKQYMLWAGLALSLTAHTLFADRSSTSMEERLTAIENQLAEKNEVIPKIDRSPAFFAESSYLLWRSYEEGFTLGTSAGLKDLEFSWDSGFRAGIGAHLPIDSWETKVVWTHLHSRAQGSVVNIGRESIVLDKDTLHIHLNVIDGCLARFFKVTPHLSFKPYAGVRGLLMSQVNNDVLTTIYTSGNENTSETKTSFRSRGVGLRAGVDASWLFGYGLSLYTNVGGSLLSTSFNNQQVAIDLSLETKGVTVLKTRSTLVPTVDFALGLGWEHSFEGQAALSLSAGWEFNDFFAQVRPLVSGYSNDLTYQGLTANIRLDF